MCGLPFARREPPAVLVAAPVPSLPEFRGIPQYWSELVVREASPYRSIDQTFGRRIAFTVPDSQSGCLAALQYFMTSGGTFPLFKEIIAPQITPLGAIKAVLEGDAEIAPIDSYAFALLNRYRPDLTSQLRVIARTAPTPIPAFVASPGALSPDGLESLRSAFLEAHEIPLTRELMGRLLLQRFEHPLPDSYDVLRGNFEEATRYWSAHPLAALTDPAFQSFKR
jgi:ABC-type phosphate/phosphonate transport system substrate-binding protein